MSLECTRGDTLAVSIILTDIDGNDYKLQEDDILLFTIRKSTKHDEDKNPVLYQTQLTTTTLIIPSNFTESLKEGQYTYDIELTQADKTVTTVVKPDILEITPEVTW